MIGIWHSYVDIYLYVAGVAMLAAFGIPLLVAPIRWARFFRWQVPQPEDLVIFLGRSIGAFITVLAVFNFKVAQTPAMQPFFLNLTLWLFAAMLVLHIYGAIKKTQPITETAEILLWAVLILITLCFYPS